MKWRCFRSWLGLACLSVISVSVQAQSTGDPDILPGGKLTLDQPADTSQAPDPSDAYTLTAYWENDSAYTKPNSPSDRYYTNGIKITMTHQLDWANRVAEFMESFLPIAKDDQPPTSAAGYLVSLQMFTPRDLDRRDVDVDDRPYAGWLYTGVYIQRATDEVLDHIEVNLGVVGSSSSADHLQEWIHEVFNSDEPSGWDNQLGDEFGFNFIYRRKGKLRLSNGESALQSELIPQGAITAGTVSRHLSADVTGRVGWNLPGDFGLGRLEDVAAATAAWPVKGVGLYGFVRIGGKVVEHNLFLEGNTHRDSHHVDVETFVGEVQVGLVMHCGAMELGYSQTYVTKEFDGQDHHHSYGSVMISCRCRF